VFDGQVTGDFCFYSYLDIRQFLVAKSTAIFVFAVTWTKDSLMDTSLEIFVFSATWTQESDGQVTGDLCLCSYLDKRQ